MFVKYSDATIVEKTASKKISSVKPLEECCHYAADTTGADGNFSCPGCGNELYVAKKN